MHDLAAAGRMANMDGVLQIEMSCHCGEIIGVVIHVMTIADLAGSAMSPPVMSDDAIAMRGKKASACPSHRPTTASHG